MFPFPEQKRNNTRTVSSFSDVNKKREVFERILLFYKKEEGKGDR